MWLYAFSPSHVGTRRAALLEQESHTKERSTPRSYIFSVKSICYPQTFLSKILQSHVFSLSLPHKPKQFAFKHPMCYMDSKNETTDISLIKLDFIQRVLSEKSLDTLRVWLDMYDEARYVASIDSNEEELKIERSNTMKRFHLKTK
jgi:hypothetical protein